MPTEILMPALSPTMEEGKLAKWLIKEGQSVKAGDVIAEIETDKATMEFEAVDEGKIASISVPEGTDNVKVGTVIATAQPIPEPPTRSVQPAPAQVATATPSESPPSDRERRREAKKQRRDERKRHRDARKRRKRSRNAESRAPDS